MTAKCHLAVGDAFVVSGAWDAFDHTGRPLKFVEVSTRPGRSSAYLRAFESDLGVVCGQSSDGMWLFVVLASGGWGWTSQSGLSRL